VFVCLCDLGHLRVRVCGPRCHSGSSLYIYRVYLRGSSLYIYRVYLRVCGLGCRSGSSLYIYRVYYMYATVGERKGSGRVGACWEMLTPA
jgi:hypothetical protein